MKWNLRHVTSALLLGVALFISSGCSTMSLDKNLLYGTITQAMTIAVLDENPKYEPALQALAAGIDTVLLKQSITPEEISAFVTQLGEQHRMSDKSKLLIATAIDEFQRHYLASTGETSIDLTKPELAAALRSFKEGIQRGIVFYRLVREIPADMPLSDVAPEKS